MKFLSAGLLATALLCAEAAWGQESFSQARHSDLGQLRVSVFNTSPISPKAIEDAEGEAGRIFLDAGITVIWLNCFRETRRETTFGRCAEVSFPSHLHLHILPTSRALLASTVGLAFLDENGEGCCADLF